MYPSYNGDSETFNSISYADCAGIEIPKVKRKTIALVITNHNHPEYTYKNEANCRTTQARSFTTLTTTPSSTPSRRSASQTHGQRQSCELFSFLAPLKHGQRQSCELFAFLLGSLEVFNSLDETLAKPSWRFGDGVSFLEPQQRCKLLRVVILNTEE